MEEQDHHLLQPLISTTFPAAATGTSSHKADDNIRFIISSNSGIIIRFLLIILIGTVSVWANYEASKGLIITVINDSGNSSPGKRFSLFYVSNDKATRIVLTTSQFVENLLYPEDHHTQTSYSPNPKKQVNHVILRLATQNLTTKFLVESTKNHEYILHLCPSIMDQENYNHEVSSAVLKGMSRIWLWDGDGQGNSPQGLINGMVEYISSLAGLTPELPEYSDDGNYWEGKDAIAVAQLLDYCEKQNVGFIRRLNQAMRNDWHTLTSSKCIIE